MFRSSAPFESQFRWEVDRWVFRFRQRGAPVEVTRLERDRLVARHIQRTRTITRTWFAGVFAFCFLSAFAMPYVPSSWLAAGYFSTAILLGFGLRYWADQAVTLPLRRRLPVGEKLGFLGAWMMRAEVTSWPQLLLGFAAVIPASILVLTLPDDFSRVERWTSAAVVMLVGAMLMFMAALKLLIDWRERRRNAWRDDLKEARDLRVD
ncbi:hypothetical protein [Sphingomonas daechungensis]|uniref:hypothetical protein n=1 Tax=Sphingomonas daechungensis TaxID=1176646 RepID=UPI0037837A87